MTTRIDIPAGAHPLHGSLLYVGERLLDTVHGEFRAVVFQNFSTRSPVVVVSRGDLRSPEPLLTRVHSSCVTSEAYGGRDCDCSEQLHAALGEIARAGRGVVFYLMQEGRGAGFAAKARDRMIVQASRHRMTTFEAYEEMGLGRDRRRYDEVGFACRLLGIAAPFVLMTNNPDKVAAIEAEKIPVAGLRRLKSDASPFNLHYIEAKTRSGHALDGAGDAEEAELPEPVESFAPHALTGEARFVRMASYLLPLRVDGADEEPPRWFRVHVYFDVAASRERVILTFGDSGQALPLVCVQDEDLFDRFPLRQPGPAKRRWRAAVARMAAHGAGCALFLSADADPDPATRDLDGAALLISHHLPARRAHPIIDRRTGGAAFCDALLRHGVTIEKRVLLDEG